jgi:nitronate monooxygenase
MGLKAGPLARWMLRGSRTKRLMRTLYALKSMWQLKRALLEAGGAQEYWQAGKSVAGIHAVRSAAQVIAELVTAP